MIILEGCDCTGKTTLAQYLSQQTTAKVDHLGLPPAGTRHWDLVRKALLSNPQNTIYDRMVIGSWVFRQCKPDKFNINGVTDFELNAWTGLVEDLPNTMIVGCHTSIDTVLHRLKERGDAYINANDLRASHELYQSVFENWFGSGCENLYLYDSRVQTPAEFYSDYRHVIAKATANDNYFSKKDQQLIERVMR